ncbi:MAG: DUF4157 domain-containing protein [Bacteroidales bacterium]|nr:DUF4157 domain-containing protein [Bacteroidales bacterium]
MEHLQTLSESRLSAPMGEAPAFSRSAPSRTIVHAKLEMTTPGDFDESEADSAADDILAGRPLSRAIAGRAGDGSGLAFPSELESTLLSQKGGGIAMPSVALKSMGHAFGQDFSQVRIHADSTAARLSKSIAARAFTHGNDIFFNQGQYDPASNEGRRLLAHELAHVAQKSGKIARDTDHALQTSIVHDFFVSNWNWGLFYTYLNSYHPSVVKRLGLKLNDGFFFSTNWEKERGVGFLKEVSEWVVYDFRSKKRKETSSLSHYDDAISEFRLLEMIYKGSIAPAFSALLTLTQNQKDKAKTHSDYASHSSIEKTKEEVAKVGNRKVDFKGTLFDNRDEPIRKMYGFLKEVYPDALSYYNPFGGFFGRTESIKKQSDLKKDSEEFAAQVEKFLDEFITKRYKDYLKENNLNPSKAEEKEEVRRFLSLFESEVAEHARSYEAAGVLLSIVRCRQKTVYSMTIHTPKCLVSAEAWTQLFVDIMIQGGTMLLGGPLVGKIVSNVVIKNPLAKKAIVESSKRAMDAVAGTTDETLRQLIHHENLDAMAILKEAGMSAVYGKVMDETLKIGAKGYKAIKNRPKLDEPLTNPQLVPDKRMLDLPGGNQPLMLNNLQPKPHTPQKSLIESPSPKQPAPEPAQTSVHTGKPDVEMNVRLPDVPTTKISFNDADLIDADIIVGRSSTPEISTSKPTQVPKPNVTPKPSESQITALVPTSRPNKPALTALEPEVLPPVPVQNGHHTLVPKPDAPGMKLNELDIKSEIPVSNQTSPPSSNTRRMTKAEVDKLNAEGTWVSISENTDIFIPGQKSAVATTTTGIRSHSRPAIHTSSPKALPDLSNRPTLGQLSNPIKGYENELSNLRSFADATHLQHPVANTGAPTTLKALPNLSNRPALEQLSNAIKGYENDLANIRSFADATHLQHPVADTGAPTTLKALPNLSNRPALEQLSNAIKGYENNLANIRRFADTYLPQPPVTKLGDPITTKMQPNPNPSINAVHGNPKPKRNLLETLNNFFSPDEYLFKTKTWSKPRKFIYRFCKGLLGGGGTYYFQQKKQNHDSFIDDITDKNILLPTILSAGSGFSPWGLLSLLFNVGAESFDYYNFTPERKEHGWRSAWDKFSSLAIDHLIPWFAPILNEVGDYGIWYEIDNSPKVDEEKTANESAPFGDETETTMEVPVNMQGMNQSREALPISAPNTMDTSPESNSVQVSSDNNTEQKTPLEDTPEQKEAAITPSPLSIEELNQHIVDATDEALNKMDIKEESSSVQSALDLINLAKGQSEQKKTDNKNKSGLTKVKVRALADKVRDRASSHNKNKHPSLSKEYYSIAAYLYDLAAKKSRTIDDREVHTRLAEQCRKKASEMSTH